MSIEDLKEFTVPSSGGKYVKINADNPKFEGEFVDVEKTTNNFGPTVHYKFLVGGVEKILDKASKRLGAAFYLAEIEVGDMVEIEQTGTGYETDYKVKKKI